MNRKCAIISVTDKTNIVSFAKSLVKLDYDIISTGNTLALLKKAKVPVISICEMTKMSPMLDGRVKTLHPVIHAGISALRNNEKHLEELDRKKIRPIDMVVVNLYDFKSVANNKSLSEIEILDRIDIGGPTLLRSAAKNYNSVLPICDIEDYEYIVSQECKLSTEQRRKLALKVFKHTEKYDFMVREYFEHTFEGGAK